MKHVTFLNSLSIFLGSFRVLINPSIGKPITAEEEEINPQDTCSLMPSGHCTWIKLDHRARVRRTTGSWGFTTEHHHLLGHFSGLQFPHL
jgi:hypothetical protein